MNATALKEAVPSLRDKERDRSWRAKEGQAQLTLTRIAHRSQFSRVLREGRA